MKARYQYRIYPTNRQKQSLAQLFGCVRVAWNDALAFCKDAEKYPGASTLSVNLTQAKKTPEREWLKDVSSVPLQQAIQDLDVAYSNFFKSVTGKRKGPKVNPPRFKKKTNQQSARFTKNGFRLTASKVYLAKIGEIKTKWSRPLPSKPSSVTVIKDCANRYFVSFVVEREPIQLDSKNQSVGVDLGIKTFATLSTGEKVQSPGYNRLDKKIRRFQRKLARQVKGSNRRERTRLKIAKLHNRIADIRKDFLHKLSTRLVRENSVVCLEDLNVKGMVKNRKLARTISQQGWGQFRLMCEAKSTIIEDREVSVISRWEPTSQLCSDCGYHWGKLDLSVRDVVCLNCGTLQDRDINASKNIAKSGVGLSQDSKWTGRARKTGLPAMPDEPSTSSLVTV
jgi:putative transposase